MASYNILNVVILNHPHPWQVLRVLMLMLSGKLADKPASKLAVACKRDSQGEVSSGETRKTEINPGVKTIL